MAESIGTSAFSEREKEKKKEEEEEEEEEEKEERGRGRNKRGGERREGKSLPFKMKNKSKNYPLFDPEVLSSC